MQGAHLASAAARAARVGLQLTPVHEVRHPHLALLPTLAPQVGTEAVHPCAWWPLQVPFDGSACPLTTHVSLAFCDQLVEHRQSAVDAYLHSASAQPPSATANKCAGKPARQDCPHASRLACVGALLPVLSSTPPSRACSRLQVPQGH